MDKIIRKIMTVRKALNPRDEVEIVNVPRKEGRKGFASIQESLDASIQRLEDGTKMLGGRLITVTRKMQTTQASTNKNNRKIN